MEAKEFQEKHGVNKDWLLTGQGSMKAVAAPAIQQPDAATYELLLRAMQSQIDMLSVQVKALTEDLRLMREERNELVSARTKTDQDMWGVINQHQIQLNRIATKMEDAAGTGNLKALGS